MYKGVPAKPVDRAAALLTFVSSAVLCVMGFLKPELMGVGVITIAGHKASIVAIVFDTPSFRMHFWMTCLLSTLLGLMVFLIGTLDNPFRGKVSIGAGSMQRVYEQIMVQHASAADGALSRQAISGGGR